MLNPIVLIVLGFVAAVLAVFGVYSLFWDLFLRDRTQIAERLDREMLKRHRGRPGGSVLFKDLQQMMAEQSAGADRGLKTRLNELVEQSGMEITVRRLLTIAGATGLALGLVAWAVFGSLILGGMLAVIGAAIPLVYVQSKRFARLEKLRSQLPDTFDLMARVIRAGQTMSQALQAVGDEFEAPVSTEFGLCFEQQNLGLPPEDSLRDLSRRTGLIEIRIFVLAMLVQRQTGGNIAELLDKLSRLIRERFRIRGMIKALTAEGRFQAGILLALPLVMFGVLMILNPEYGGVLLQYPSLVIGMLISEALGALWIRQIVNFDF